MVQYRDIILKRQAREARKQDKLPFKRAVLTTEGGVQTATADPFSEVWASESERRVWHMVDGAVQPAQVLCRKVSDPYVGLGVIIGYADGSNQLEVLADDFFLTGTGDPSGWASSSPRDLEPGGRKQLWVYTKIIVPLATYPGTGVAVNVIGGDYPYLGTRKTYAGTVNYDLSGSIPGAGLARYTGLYLDSANTLQIIDGATTTAGSTPAEPSWPAGAFRLCVVLLTDGDTSIDFSSILDRRMAWSDEQGGKSWPFANILTVSSTDPDADYTTIGAAITAASAGDIIEIDAETYTETLTISKNLSLVCKSPAGATITTASDDATTLTVTTGTVFLGNLKVTNTGAGTNSYALKITGGTVTASLCTFSKSSGAPTNSYGAKIEGGTNTFYNCYCAAITGTNQYGLYADTGASDTSYFNGVIRGDTYDVTTNNAGVNLFIRHAELYTPTREYNNTAGNLLGRFYSQAGNLLTINGTGLSSGVWLTDESAMLRKKYATLATAVTNAASGDGIRLDADTYSINATQNIDVNLTIEGDGPEATIIDCTGSNITAFDITTNSISVTFKDLTIKHTGGGVAATGIFSNNTGVTVILDNCVIEISSGAPTTGRGLWIESGTWILRNGSKITITSGTSKYGIYNDSAAATITIGAGCEVGGATADVYGDQAGSTLNIYGILTNRLATWAGAVDGIITPIFAAFSAEIYQGVNIGLADFVATINGAPSGASVVYNAPSSGDEATIKPQSTSQLAKMVLHNTTRGDSALISDVNTGTNTITLTANAPGTWQNGDTITIRSQTNTSTFGSSYFVDFEITSTEVDPLVTGLELELSFQDSGGAGQSIRLHPFEANATSKRRGFNTQSTQLANGYRPIPIISSSFCATWTSSGTTTIQNMIFRAQKQLIYGL